MAVLAKNGVWLGAFLTEVDFSYRHRDQIFTHCAVGVIYAKDKMVTI